MKKTVIVMSHQENQATPIAAEEASVSIVRIALTVKRTRSARPSTRSRTGGAVAGAGAGCPGVMLLGTSYPRKALRDNDFRFIRRRFRSRRKASAVIGSRLFVGASRSVNHGQVDPLEDRRPGSPLPGTRHSPG